MHFDIGLARGIVTVVWFLIFIAVCCWAWSGRRRQDFAAAARLPLEDAADAPARNGDDD